MVKAAAIDPFADEAEDITADVKDATNVTTGPWAPDSNPASSEVSVTLKGGPGYDEPWVVLRGGDVPTAAALVTDVEPLKELLTGTRAASDFFHSTRKVTESTAAPAASAPAARESAPNGAVKECKHGSMQFRSGVSASTGKPWKAFFCPTPKGTPDQCAAEFIR